MESDLQWNIHQECKFITGSMFIYLNKTGCLISEVWRGCDGPPVREAPRALCRITSEGREAFAAFYGFAPSTTVENVKEDWAELKRQTVDC